MWIWLVYGVLALWLAFAAFAIRMSWRKWGAGEKVGHAAEALGFAVGLYAVLTSLEGALGWLLLPAGILTMAIGHLLTARGAASRLHLQGQQDARRAKDEEIPRV